jgi:hypothetical protein
MINREYFVVGFVKKAMSKGLNEEQSISLLKKAAPFNASGGLSSMFKGVALPKGTAPKMNLPKPNPQSPQIANPVKNVAQQAPPIMRPVQPNLAKQVNPTPNMGQFEQQQAFHPSANPVQDQNVDNSIQGMNDPMQIQALMNILRQKQQLVQ